MRRAIHCVVPLLLMMLPGCAAPRIDNVRLGSADLVTMTDQMAASLLSNPAIASRTSTDAPWIVTLDRVTNNTSDIIPENEKWAFMTRLRAMLSQSPSLNSHALRFVLPLEHAEALDEPSMRLIPTHALAATFYTADTYSRQGQSAAYLCAFQLIDLKTDRIIWEDRYEVKRNVERSKWD